MSYATATSLDRLWVGDMLGCVVSGRRVLIVRLDDGVFAYEDRCAHMRMPLSTGRLDGHVLTCAGHHYEYDVRTGAGINPVSLRLRPIPVRVDGREVLVDPDETGGPCP